MKPNPHQFFRDADDQPAVTPRAAQGSPWILSSPVAVRFANQIALSLAIASLAVPALGLYLIRVGSGLAIFEGAAPFGAGTGFAFDYAGIMGMFAAAVQIIVVTTGIFWTMTDDPSAHRVGHPILLAWATLWFVATLTGMSSPGSLEWIGITSIAGLGLLATVIRAASALTQSTAPHQSLARITPDTLQGSHRSHRTNATNARQHRRAA